jgi:hypothetical protein
MQLKTWHKIEVKMDYGYLQIRIKRGNFMEKMGFTKIVEIPRYVGQNSEILYIKNFKD